MIASLAKFDLSVMLPGDASKAQQRMLDELKNFGKKFYKVYKADILGSRAKAVTPFTKYTTSRHPNASIKTVAMSALPTIKMQHDEVKTLIKMQLRQNDGFSKQQRPP